MVREPPSPSLPAVLPSADRRPWPAQPPVLAPAAAGGAGLAGASSCSAPGGAPGSEIRAPGAGLGGSGRSPHPVRSRPGCQARAASLSRRASASRLLAVGVSRETQRPALPAPPLGPAASPDPHGQAGLAFLLVAPSPGESQSYAPACPRLGNRNNSRRTMRG